MTATDPPVAFVLARLDEEEALAKACLDEGAEPEWDRAFGAVLTKRDPNVWSKIEPDVNGALARHVAAHDPGITLARCAALRELVGRHERFVEYGEVMCRSCAYPSETTGDLTGGDWPCDVVRGVAAIWAWHPDYREARAS